MMATADNTTSPAPAADAAPEPSRLGQGLGVACDVVLMIAALLAAWWAWDGAGATRSDSPAWTIATTPATGETVTLKLEPQQPWLLGEQPIAHDRELAVAARGAPGSAKITADGRVLFSHVARALELLGREGVHAATLNVVD